MKKIDIVLVVPPQWSPFQPPLSLPSLRAWLNKQNISSKCTDLNIEFYWWLLSDECASILLGTLETATLPEQTKTVYRLIFSQAKTIKRDVENIYEKSSRQNIQQLQNHFISIKSLEFYLRAISAVESSFSISPYEFKLSTDCYNERNLEDFVESPPLIISSFVDTEVTRILSENPARSIGLSCIGQEQLAFTMLLGKRFKELGNLPVVVGGTILPRIHNKGTLPSAWLGKYFDIVVVNEGEKPLEQLMRYFIYKDRNLNDIEGIIFLDHDSKKIISTNPATPLTPTETPIPDFDDMPLTRYFSSEVTLPLLSSRGCYWGKCAFCHHGMIYGEKHSSYEVDSILQTLNFYAERYGVNCFAFNDEAIPPKILKKMGALFPSNSSSGWSFTGLIKFEKNFKKSDFANASRIGFKSLYVGLESASEKVLQLMKKRSSKEIMISNLSDATEAGILMHCFVFFGFPGEDEADAQQTYDFLLANRDIIGSIGCGVFTLEHDAPIFHDLEAFGVSLLPEGTKNLNIYYQYKVKSGIAAKRANAWAKQLNDEIFNIPKYASINWIPREHQLSIFKHCTAQEISRWGEELIKWRHTLPNMQIGQLVLSKKDDEGITLVNRLNRKSFHVTGYTANALSLMLERNISIAELRELSEELFTHIASSRDVLPEFTVDLARVNSIGDRPFAVTAVNLAG